MMMSGSTDGMLVEAFTGLVVESLAVTQDLGSTTVGCRGCAGGERRLGNGGRAHVALSCYEDFGCEIEGVRPEKQAVVDTVLKSTGYHARLGGIRTRRAHARDCGCRRFQPDRRRLMSPAPEVATPTPSIPP